MTSTLGLRKPYQIQRPEQAEDIDAMFEQLYRRIADLQAQIDGIDSGGTGGGGVGPHELLSADHTDTTPAAVVNGDLIVGQAGKWARFPIASNGEFLQLAAGLPAWGHDGTLLTNLAASALVGTLPGSAYGTIPVSSYLHNFLSTAHGDTTPASAVLGDLVVAQAGTAVDTQQYWIDGEAFGVLPTTGDPGTGDFWIDGEAWGSLVTTGSATWQRKAKGTSGYVLTATAAGPEWQANGGGSGASAAAVYRSSDFVLADLTPTAVTLQATTFDDGPFWSSGSPTRLTVPVGMGGTYQVTGCGTWDSAFVGLAYAYLYVNGVLRATSPAAGNNASAPFTDPAIVTSVLKLNSGDYVELYLQHKASVAGTAATIKGGASSTFLQLGRFVSESVTANGMPTVAAGAIIRGNSAGNQWERYAIGAANTVLLSDGAAPGWSTRPTLRDVNETIAGASGGTWDFTNGVKERTRPVAMGIWTNVAYNSANFTASGAMTWTVDAGDQITYKYCLVGKFMILTFALNLTSVGGVADTELHVAIPGGYVGATSDVVAALRAYDNGTDTVGFCGSLAATGYIRCWRAGFSSWSAASVNNTSLQGSCIFEVS